MKKNYITIAKKLVLGMAVLGFSQFTQAQDTCGDTAVSGHPFAYELSVDASGNHFITFKPENPTTTRLLFVNDEPDFGVGANTAEDNTPFQLPSSFTTGTTLYFRYVYNQGNGQSQYDQTTGIVLGTCPDGGTLSNEVIFETSTSDISVSNGTAVISNLSGTSTISVFNITGSLVKSATTSASSTSVDVADLAQGIYILLIDNGSATQKVKMLIE